MKIPKKLKKLSNADKGNLGLRALKLNEEAGEVAEAVLRLLGRKSANGKDRAQLQWDVIEESVDTLIMTMDLLCCMKFTKKSKIKALIKQKLEKWENSVRLEPNQNR